MTTPPSWDGWIDQALASIDEAGRWRAHRTFDARGPHGTIEGASVVSFASNDYLGLTVHPAVVAAAHEALDRWGAGAGAARLVTGTRPVHDALETDLAAWKGTEAALVFPTGFATNLGVLSALGAQGAHIISDELNHASIIDGARLARAPVDIWRHGDLEHLDQLLAASPGRPLVVTDSVFSMDGDAADVRAIAERCRDRGALLVLDEAHAVLAPDVGPEVLDGLEVIRVGTLSKTLGALGGFAAGSRRVIDLLINTARPAIFTTALSPADAAAAKAAVAIVRGPEGDQLRARLRHHVDQLAPGHPSPIVPIVLGDEDRAVAASRGLADQGLFVPAIRPPTVAPGTSRLRVTLSAAHTDDEVARLQAALDRLGVPGVGASSP